MSTLYWLDVTSEGLLAQIYLDHVLVDRAAVAEDEEDDFDEEQPFIPTTFGR